MPSKSDIHSLLRECASSLTSDEGLREIVPTLYGVRYTTPQISYYFEFQCDKELHTGDELVSALEHITNIKCLISERK